MRQVATKLVLQGVAPQCLDGGPGTNSLKAVRACDRAFSALEDGNVTEASSQFEAAWLADANYSRGALWAGETRRWVVTYPADTKVWLARTLLNPNELNSREKQLAEGQRYLESGEYGRACGVYKKLADADPRDYVAWIGMGECHARDQAVVRDPAKPGAWVFRSSYEQAVRAYVQAFSIHPMLMAGYSRRSFRPLRKLLLTSSADARLGANLRNPQDRFYGYPTLNGDTLVIVPVPMNDLTLANIDIIPASLGAAIDRQRNQFRDLALQWHRGYPDLSATNEAEAVGLELNGEARAIEAMEEARARARTDDEKVRLAANEAWLRVKFSLPDGTRELRRAVRLADSLLAHAVPNGQTAPTLASLAILLGRPAKAASIARLAVEDLTRELDIPTGVIELAQALLAFASLGSSPDSMRILETGLSNAISNVTSPERHRALIQTLLTGPAMMALPDYELAITRSLKNTGVFLESENHFLDNNPQGVLASINRLAESRKLNRPADFTIDGIFVEAWLLHAVGHSAEAAQRLDSTLNAIRWFAPGSLSDSRAAGSLVRAMLLRAEIAAKTGDAETARRWSSPIITLWAEAEPVMESRVAQARRFSRGR
jgi:hypothetical protein